MSPEIDKMEEIHDALSELQLSHGNIVERFVERYVARLRQLGKELNTVRTMIDRRRHGIGRGALGTFGKN